MAKDGLVRRFIYENWLGIFLQGWSDEPTEKCFRTVTWAQTTDPTEGPIGSLCCSWTFELLHDVHLHTV